MNMTADAKDLLMKLLEIDPMKRLTASEALAHPWLSIEDEFMVDDARGLSRPRSSSVLQVESTFRDSFSRPTPPRKLPEAYKESSRLGSHGLGILRFMFGGMNMNMNNEDKEKKIEKDRERKTEKDNQRKTDKEKDTQRKTDKEREKVMRTVNRTENKTAKEFKTRI